MRFSIIVPVLNEEAVLDDQLAHLIVQCAQYDCEVLIVDGGSTDNTINIAQRYGQVIHSARGRATQMNAGA
ncbi:MAG TPA: glycosyl transferase, partial [Ktedonobacter sp.]|nr:glycosyl transferase [Ktedonobacter sp.]